MIHQNVIKRRADEDGLSASAVERDYVLAHSLIAISERDREQRPVFKGGTALRLCHFENYRYSADLDFSLTGKVDPEGATASSRRKSERSSQTGPHSASGVPPALVIDKAACFLQVYLPRKNFYEGSKQHVFEHHRQLSSR